MNTAFSAPPAGHDEAPATANETTSATGRRKHMMVIWWMGKNKYADYLVRTCYACTARWMRMQCASNKTENFQDWFAVAHAF
jgi:hypothetical protein